MVKSIWNEHLVGVQKYIEKPEKRHNIYKDDA